MYKASTKSCLEKILTAYSKNSLHDISIVEHVIVLNRTLILNLFIQKCATDCNEMYYKNGMYDKDLKLSSFLQSHFS